MQLHGNRDSLTGDRDRLNNGDGERYLKCIEPKTALEGNEKAQLGDRIRITVAHRATNEKMTVGDGGSSNSRREVAQPEAKKD